VTAATLALGAWVAAGVAAIVAVLGRRLLEFRSEAVARACHELRGPLTAVRLGLALAATVGELSPAQLRALDQELGRASLALDDLAAVRSPLPDRPRAREEGVDLSELLADSAEAWRPAAVAAGIRLEVQWVGAPARVFGDRLRLAQATGNLIANAIEHGGGTILARGRRGEASVRLEVIDDGPGLPAPVAELARGARGGRGVRGRGLAIASSIAREHGGRLAAAPCERGARLVLELPAQDGHDAVADHDAGPRPRV
jgi:signal transduction histidine kinase